MPTLLLKSWRDLRARRWQTLGLILLTAIIVATTTGAERARRMLENTRDTYYRELGFADFDIRCSPTIAGLLERVRDVPGVAAAEEIPLLPGVLYTRDVHPLTTIVRVLPEEPPEVDRLQVLEGRYPAAGEEGVVLDRSMRRVFGLAVGDDVELEMEGVRRTLPVLGLSVTPDHILYPSNPEFLIPVPGSLAALSLSAAAAKAFPHTDLVTSIRFRFEAGVVREPLQQRLLDELGVSPIAVLPLAEGPDYRTTQMILRFFDIYLPAALLVLIAVALTLLVLTLRRLVHSQEAQIGVLSATGHRPAAIAAWLRAAAGRRRHPRGSCWVRGGARCLYGRFIFQSYVNGVGFAPLRDPGPGSEVLLVSGACLLIAVVVSYALAYATADPPPPCAC